MQKVNLKDIPDEPNTSPKGKFRSSYKELSQALGHDPRSGDWKKRHPFEISLVTVPPGAANFPFHAESAQWEHYVVVSGRGTVRDAEANTEVTPGDTFIFAPGEAHQIINNSGADFVFYVFADNPMGDSCYYPDSGKWAVNMPSQSMVLQEQKASYYDGEE